MLPSQQIVSSVLVSVIVSLTALFPLVESASCQVSALRRGLEFSGRVSLLAEKVSWARMPLLTVKLAMLESQTLSKAERVAILIEKGVIEGRIQFSREVFLRKQALALEEGDKILLRFLQSDLENFEEFRKTVRFVNGGDSVALGRAIGKPGGGDWAAHHIVPSELKEHWALEKIGFDLDLASNGIALPNKANVSPILPVHKGSHPSYTAAMKKALDEIPRNLTEEETRRAVEAIQGKFRERLQTNVKESQLHENLGGIWRWPFDE